MADATLLYGFLGDRPRRTDWRKVFRFFRARVKNVQLVAFSAEDRRK